MVFSALPPTVSFAGLSDRGRRRAHNEDAWLVVPSQPCAVVADGMGGLAAGEEASRLVVESVVQAVEAGQSAQQGLVTAHRRIHDASTAAGQGRMGSTAVVLDILGGNATIFWVGDSRCYLWRDDTLKLLTRDHSRVNDLIEAGVILPEQAETHPHRHVLTRALGVHDSDQVEIDRVVLDLRPRDRLLLCSDGLHGYLAQAAIIDCLRRNTDAEHIANQLLRNTLDHTEAGDNITVVCASIE